MTYRTKKLDKQQRAKQRLVELAFRGAESSGTESSSAVQETTAQRGTGREARRRARQIRRSCSRFAELAETWFKAVMLAAGAAAFWLAPSPARLGKRPIEPGADFETTAVMVAVVWLALIIATHVIGYVVSKRAVARERAWADKMPFDVKGYFNALGRAHHTDHAATDAQGDSGVLIPAVGSVTLDVEVADPVKSREFVSALLRATVPDAECDHFASTRFSFTQRNMGCTYTCHRLRSWFHDVVDRLLIPLHEGHNIRSVTLSVERW